MIGISAIGTYLPASRIQTNELAERFQVNNDFLTNKTGFLQLARKATDESVADMCCSAYAALLEASPVQTGLVDYVCVCTQNQDMALPQVSAVLQDRLGLEESCASLDISLGCSGYVYSIVAAQAFMEKTGCKHGLVFTCDPYSPHLSPSDKNTQLLFGDGATVTYLSETPKFSIQQPKFATIGSQHMALHKEHGDTIHMDGREIFNFSMRRVPRLIEDCVACNGLTPQDIDLFVLHQASNFVVENIRKVLKVNQEQMPFSAPTYGNTVSSSIPLVLEEYLSTEAGHIILCGFGVGLSVAAVLIKRVEP